MNFTKVSKIGKSLEKITIDNSPTILTAVGVVGTVATAYLMHKATIKATHILYREDGVRTAKAKMANEPTPPTISRTDTLKLTWLCYIPPVAAGTVTITSIIFANRISAKRMAALAAGYGILDSRFDEYKAKMQEKLGVKKESDARDEIAQDRTDKNPPDSTIIITQGKALFRDEPSGRYFESTMEDIRRAENDLNRKIMKDEYAVLTDWYEMIGLPPTSLSEEYGWEITNDIVEMSKSTVITPDQRPCITLDYNVHPIRKGYSKL